MLFYLDANQEVVMFWQNLKNKINRMFSKHPYDQADGKYGEFNTTIGSEGGGAPVRSDHLKGDRMVKH